MIYRDMETGGRISGAAGGRSKSFRDGSRLIVQLRFGINTTGWRRKNAERSGGSSWNFTVLHFPSGEADYKKTAPRDGSEGAVELSRPKTF